MSVKYIQDDLFEAIKSKPGPLIIAHVVNDKGVFGAGFVLPLAKNFPEAKRSYLEWAKEEDFGMGRTKIVEVQPSPQIFVSHMNAQTLGGQRPLYYNHLARCMDETGDFALRGNSEIVAPLFGSGLAKGDWNIVEKLIEDCWVRRKVPVTVYYLPEFLPKNWIPPTT